MRELSLPWLEMSILIPLLGALSISRIRNAHLAQRWCVLVSGLSLACALGEWLDFVQLHAIQAGDRWRLMTRVFGREIFRIDQINAPLFSLIALLYFLATAATLKTKVRRFSFAWTLVSESILLATFSCTEPWVIIGLLALGTIPPFVELRARHKSTRIYALHMGLFVGLLALGWTFVEREGGGIHRMHSLWATAPLLAAVLIRSGMVPFHCWMTDLFEHATFGTALLVVTPMAGAYVAVRLVLPIAPDWVLQITGFVSLITAVYAAGMALVQRDARRFFCYLFLSHSALVLVGLEIATPLGLTGALCVWLSLGLSLGGLGLTLRALEARCGRQSVIDFQGHYEHTPNLAMCFALTGLASVGFPGTLGFIGSELLVDGAVHVYPHVGVAVVIAAALNGIAIVRTYFLLFTGTRYASSLPLPIRVSERYAVLTLAVLLLIGGFIPQANVASRHRAAELLLKERKATARAAAAIESAKLTADRR